MFSMLFMVVEGEYTMEWSRIKFICEGKRPPTLEVTGTVAKNKKGDKRPFIPPTKTQMTTIRIAKRSEKEIVQNIDQFYLYELHFFAVDKIINVVRHFILFSI